MLNKIFEGVKNNIILKMIALGIGSFIWLLVTNNNDPTKSVLFSNVAITIVNEDSIDDIGKVFEPQGSGTVTLRVTERNSVLRRLARNGSDFYVEADLANITPMNTVPLTVTCSNASVTWDEIEVQPSSLKVTLEDKVEQAFAVTVTTSGTTADGYAVGTTQVLDGKNILIAGPKSLINIINQVIAPVTVSGMRENALLPSSLRVIDKNGSDLTDSQMSRLEFKDSNGNVLTDRQVTVALEFWRERSDVPIRVETSGDVPFGYEITQISTIPQSITLIGTEETFKDLGNALTVTDAVDVTGLTEDVTYEVDLTDTIAGYGDLKLPADADPIISVDIQIEKNGDRRLEIPMGDVELLNRPENRKLVFTPADILPIIVHSRDENLVPVEDLSVDDVTVQIDLAACEEDGIYEIPVEVTLPNGYELSQNVTVTVSSMENETVDGSGAGGANTDEPVFRNDTGTESENKI